MPRIPAFVSLAGVVLLGYLAPGWCRSLWNPDEPRVAFIAVEMAGPDGDWVVPRVNGEPFLQEPPLIHWLNAAAVRALGAGPGRDWVVRLPSLAFAWGTLLLVGIHARRLFGAKGGWVAVCVLATSAEFLDVANRAGTDGALTFFVALGAFSLVEAAGEERWRVGPALLLGVAAGGSFLAKNLLGPAFLGLAFFAFLLARRDLARSAGTWLCAGVALSAFAAIAAPWLWLLGVRDPSLEGLRTVLVVHTFGRYQLEDIHDKALHKFAGSVLVNMLPWAPLVLQTVALRVAGLVRRPPQRCVVDSGQRASLSNASRAVLLGWILLPTALVFSSSSRRELYLLATFPAIAVLVADSLSPRMAGIWPRRIALALIPVATLGAVALGFFPAAPLARGLVFAGLVIEIFVAYGWLRAKGWRDAARTTQTAIAVCGLVMVSGNLVRLEIQEPRKGYLALSESVMGLREQGFGFVSFRLETRELSALGYTLGSRVEVIDDAQAAQARLDDSSRPVAIVANRKTLDADRTLQFRAAAQVPIVSARGLVILLNRPARGTAMRPAPRH